MQLLPDRALISQQLALLKQGMTAADVNSIIGPPDETRDISDEIARYERSDTSSISLSQFRIWAYGVSHNSQLPTLGQIWFDDNGHVNRVYGGAKFVDSGSFSEIDLRHILEVIDQSPPPLGRLFNPKKLVYVVNKLQHLGKAAILEAVREYLRIAPLGICINHSYTGLFCVLRVLFSNPEPGRPWREPKLGAHWFNGRIDMGVLREFPIVLQNGVPWCIVSDYVLAGKISIQEELDNAANGNLLPTCLLPSNQPLASWEALWSLLDSESLTHDEDLNQATLYRILVNQLLRLLSDVYPASEIDSKTIDLKALKSIYDHHSQQIAKLDIQWSSDRSQYIFTRS